MDRHVIDTLFERILATFRDVVTLTEDLTDEDLDGTVTGYGGRETRIRQVLYTMANHDREHVNHIDKILRVTDAPGARPSEAQSILGQGAEALGQLHAVLLRVADADLDRSHEDQSLREVLEHVAATQENYAGYLREGLNK